MEWIPLRLYDYKSTCGANIFLVGGGVCKQPKVALNLSPSVSVQLFTWICCDRKPVYSALYTISFDLLLTVEYYVYIYIHEIAINNDGER